MKRVLFSILLLSATPLAAQQDSTLAVVVQLATEGRSDSARALVRQRLAQLTPGDSIYPGALFVAGVIASDRDSALTYFRRVSIEFPRSPWADSAYLRLAQLAFAAGDADATVRASERILTDYPLSALRPEASLWAGRAHLELGSAAEGCQLLLQARDAAGVDIELANRAAYHIQRCAAVLATPDSTGADTVQPVRPPPTGPPVFSVQVAAVQTPAAADQVMRSLVDAGYEPHVVRDADGLFKVRVGRYADRGAAQRMVTTLRRDIGGSPFVVEQR
jgi:hypothetical protein